MKSQAARSAIALVERFRASSMGSRRCCRDLHVFFDRCATGTDKIATDFHDARVASLNRSELRVIADLRQLGAGPVYYIDQTFARRCLYSISVDRDVDHVRLPHMFQAASGTKRPSIF